MVDELNPGDLVLVDYSSEGDCSPLLEWAKVRAIYFIAQKVDKLPGDEPPAIQQITRLFIESPGGAGELIGLNRVSDYQRGDYDSERIAAASYFCWG